MTESSIPAWTVRSLASQRHLTVRTPALGFPGGVNQRWDRVGERLYIDFAAAALLQICRYFGCPHNDSSLRRPLVSPAVMGSSFRFSFGENRVEYCHQGETAVLNKPGVFGSFPRSATGWVRRRPAWFNEIPDRSFRPWLAALCR